MIIVIQSLFYDYLIKIIVQIKEVKIQVTFSTVNDYCHKKNGLKIDFLGS